MSETMDRLHALCELLIVDCKFELSDVLYVLANVQEKQIQIVQHGSHEATETYVNFHRELKDLMNSTAKVTAKIENRFLADVNKAHE